MERQKVAKEEFAASLINDVKVSDVQIADIKVPDFKAPDIKVPDFKAPDIQVPDFKVDIPKIPDLKSFSLPKLDVPDMPKVDIPSPPKLNTPSFDSPKFSLPTVPATSSVDDAFLESQEIRDARAADKNAAFKDAQAEAKVRLCHSDQAG